MYILLTAYHRDTPRNGKWVEVDLSQVPIKQLPTTHGDVWFFVTYPSNPEPQALYFEDIINRLNGVSVDTTVSQWLTDVGNDTLPFRDTLPTFDSYYVHYTNAWHAGYRVEPITRIGTISQQGSKWDKEDLLIWRDDVDPEYLGRHALFSVNGLYHFAEYGPEGVHIHNGNRTLRRSNDNQVGVHSFANVGEVDHIPITQEMCMPVQEGYPYYRGVYITLPDDVDIENKTVLLVIGGYLQVLGSTYTRVGDRTFRLEMDNLGRLERFYGSVTELGLRELGLTQYERNDSLLDVTEFQSDAFIKAYLGMSQTFFVTVDCPSFFHEVECVEDAKLPGRYYDRTGTPRYPLMGAYGRMLEYSTIHENGVTVLCTMLNRRHNYDFHHYPWRKKKIADDGRLPSHPFDEGQAFYRIMGTQK